MDNKTKINIAILYFLVLALVIFSAYQYKKISQLEGQGISNYSQTQNDSTNSLSNVLRQFHGRVISVSGSKITVETELTDFKKPKDSEKMSSGEVLHLSSDDFETIKKTIQVNTNESTKFGRKKIDEIEVGDTVYVISDKSPYENAEVTAISISLSK